MISITRPRLRRWRPALSSMGAEGLMRESDQRQHRGTDHDREYAEIKRRALDAGTAPMTGRSMMNAMSGTEKRPARRRPGSCGEQKPRHPAHGVDPEPCFNPCCTARHVLQDDRQRHGETSHEAASRQVVSAQEQIHCHGPDDRKQKPHNDGGPTDNRRWYRPFAALDGRHRMHSARAAVRDVDTLRRWAESPQ